MRIVAFVDLHGSFTALKKLEEKAKRKNADVIVCAGDLTIFEQNLDDILERLDSIGKRVLVVHGNHETEEIMKAMCRRLKNVEFIHKKIVDVNGYAFAGFGGGGFSLVDKEFEKWQKQSSARLRGKKIVFLTHAPPYGTSLDLIYDEHAGSKSLVKFIKHHSPLVVACGHLHENAGKRNKIGRTLAINPGPEGVIIELK